MKTLSRYAKVVPLAAGIIAVMLNERLGMDITLATDFSTELIMLMMGIGVIGTPNAPPERKIYS